MQACYSIIQESATTIGTRLSTFYTVTFLGDTLPEKRLSCALTRLDAGVPENASIFRTDRADHTGNRNVS